MSLVEKVKSVLQSSGQAAASPDDVFSVPVLDALQMAEKLDGIKAEQYILPLDALAGFPVHLKNEKSDQCCAEAFVFEARSTIDLINIASAGGGMEINVGARPTMDLINLAHAAAKSGARITMRGLGARPAIDLINIAHAGKGCVSFGD